MPTRIEGQCTYALRLLVVSSPSSASNCSDHSFQAWGYSAVVAWVAVVGAEEGAQVLPFSLLQDWLEVVGVRVSGAGAVSV